MPLSRLRAQCRNFGVDEVSPRHVSHVLSETEAAGVVDWQVLLSVELVDWHSD